MNRASIIDNTSRVFSFLLLIFAMTAFSIVMVFGGIPVGMLVALLPLTILMLLVIIKKPFVGYIVLLMMNYFVIGIIQYTNIQGLSLVNDILMFFILISVILNQLFGERQKYSLKEGKGIIIVSIVWFLFCCLETLNSTAVMSAWLLSRGLMYNALVFSVLALLMMTNAKRLQTFLIILSVLTLLGAFKGVWQQIFGFDSFEQRVLNEDLGRTHLLASGTRYFSFFASAGVFGVVMGYALVVFLILGIYEKKKSLRYYFWFVSLMALYGLLISGTRGAMVVPGVGFALFILLSKRVQLMIPSAIAFVVVFGLLAFTKIGSSNALIRRMRTIFDPNEPSLLVRLENQRKLAEYMKERPFGEGLGLSGVEGQVHSYRFTTTIPTDSWYVKIWVETGIVGLTLYLAILLYLVCHSVYLILFKLKNEQIRGIMVALVSGVVGVLFASYGNSVLGQFPVTILTYTSIAILFMSPTIERRMNDIKY